MPLGSIVFLIDCMRASLTGSIKRLKLRLLFEANAVLGGEGSTHLLQVGVDDGLDRVLVGIDAFSSNADMQVAVTEMAERKAADVRSAMRRCPARIA